MEKKYISPSSLFSSFPLVSIIIPAFNAEKTIAYTLDSVIRQTYKNLEIIVVDDGSEDNTYKIIKSIANKDRRVKLIEQANNGVASARNTAIQTATGLFIAPIDADDLWHPEKIQKQLDIIARNKNIGLVYTWVHHIDENNNVIGSSTPFEISGHVYAQHMLKNFIGNGSSILVPTHVLREAGGYDPALRAQGAEGAEDHKLQLKIAELYEFEVVPEYLTGYRKTDNSMSSNSQAMCKSKELVISDAAHRNSQLPKHIFKWALASSQYSYGRCLIRKKVYISGLKLILKSALNDPIRMSFLLAGEVKKTISLIKVNFFSKKANRKDRINFFLFDSRGIVIKRKKDNILLRKRMNYAKTLDLKAWKKSIHTENENVLSNIRN